MSYLEDRLYSAAFNDGFDYAVEKLFADKDEKNKRVTMRQAELEEELGKNWSGALPALLGYGSTVPIGYLVGRSEVNKALREGKSDEELKEKADRVGRINRYVNEGLNGVGGGLAGGILSHDPKISGSIPGLKEIKSRNLRTATGAALGAGFGYGVGKLYGKLGEYAIGRNADEAIRRRTKYREDKD